MAARLLAQLGSAAAAAPPACFDAAQAGGSLWAAARAPDERSVTVTHAPLLGAGGSSNAGGSVHAVLALPEPVAAVQLGVPAADAGGSAGTAVLLAVGVACRVWAFALHPPLGSAADAAPAQVAAAADAGALVPVAQQRCPARHQLAAAVAWEHLCYSWDPSAAVPAAQPQQRAGGRALRGRSAADASSGAPAPAGATPLSLSMLQAALQLQLTGKQAPHVHSVATWVCLPQEAAAAAAIPADATAAAYLRLSAGSGGGAPVERLACSSRWEAPASAAGAAHGAAGYLAVATASGRLLALPVGTPYSSGSSSRSDQLTSSDARLPLAACWGAGSLCFLPSAACDGAPARLALLAETGLLVPAAVVGLGGGAAVVVAPGSAGGGGDAKPHSNEQPFAATVQLVGAQAAAAVGSRLLYLPASGGGDSGLRCLDASNALSADSASTALELPSATQPCLLAAAAQQLVLVSAEGALSALPTPALASLPASGSGQLSVRRLEARIQGLLGGIAELSAQQEQQEARQAALDDCIAGLAVALPLAQGLASGHGSGGGGGGGLRCTLRPLALRSRALSGGGGGGGGEEALALEVRLDNRSQLPLSSGWSLVLVHSGAHSTGGGSSSAGGNLIAFSAPLGGLPPGAEWRQECLLPLPAAAGGGGGGAGLLRVLLCRHGDGEGADCGEGADGDHSSCVLLLHSVRLDALHLLRLRREQQTAAAAGGGGSSGCGSGAPPLQSSMALQLPRGRFGLAQPAADELLRQLLDQGLSSQAPPLGQQQQQGEQQQGPASLPAPAFSLLLPPAPASSGPGSASSSVAAEGVSVSAQLLPTAAHRGEAAAAPLLQVTAAAADPAQLLACHQGLCHRALTASAAAAAEQQQRRQQQPPWPQLASGGVLVPPGAISGGALAVDDATLEQALMQLRQLRELALELRSAAAQQTQQADSEFDAAGAQRAWQAAAAELLRLALAARDAQPPVLIA